MIKYYLVAASNGISQSVLDINTYFTACVDYSKMIKCIDYLDINNIKTLILLISKYISSCNPDDVKKCYICYNKYKIIKLSCNHEICINCAINPKVNSCPFCRGKLNIHNNYTPKVDFMDQLK